MNTANKLTIARLIFVPVFLVIMFLPSSIIPRNVSFLLGAFLFIAASVTDFIDGRIARKYNTVTNFGKFLDPLADKFMVIGALFVIIYRFAGTLRLCFIFLSIIVVFRELAVTAIRLVAVNAKNVVIAANFLGKVKTVFQIVCISAVLIEAVLWPFVFGTVFKAEGAWFFDSFIGGFPITAIAMIGTGVLTVWSGIIYLINCWKYINPNK